MEETNLQNVKIEQKAAVGGNIISNTSLAVHGTDNNGIQSTLEIKSGSQKMLFDGNEIDSYSTSALYLQNNSDNNIILANGGGNVGLAETSPAAMLHIKQVGNEEGLIIENNSDSDKWAFEVGANDLQVKFNDVIKANIDDVDGSWDQTSDRRLKKDINYDARSILSSILALKPASYRYIDNAPNDPLSYGFIAQEVQELFPELVKENEESEFLTISYSEFSVLAIKAIQEQQDIINQQNKSIKDLADKYEILLSKITDLEK